jgi:hypothetical protein
MVAPSVFLKSGWVHHKLMAMKLGATWDLPVDMLASLAKNQVDSREELEVFSDISQTTPCKSLWPFGQSMLLFGLCPDSMEDFDTLTGQESTTGTKGDSDS